MANTVPAVARSIATQGYSHVVNDRLISIVFGDMAISCAIQETLTITGFIDVLFQFDIISSCRIRKIQSTYFSKMQSMVDARQDCRHRKNSCRPLTFKAV
jgi:hypothetical protein